MVKGSVIRIFKCVLFHTKTHIFISPGAILAIGRESTL